MVSAARERLDFPAPRAKLAAMYAGSFAIPLSLSPANVTENAQISAAVRLAVNSLPTELRQIVVMKEFEELTFREISEALDLPLSTVKSRLYTALKQLEMKLLRFGSEAA